MLKTLPPFQKCSEGTYDLILHCMFILHFICFITVVKSEHFQSVIKLT